MTSYISSIYFYYFNDEIVIVDTDKSDITKIYYDLETNVLSIDYIVKGNQYKLKHSLSNKINDSYIKELLNNENPEKPILTALLNDSIDITGLMNEYCGPNGDFYKNEFKMYVSYVIPEKYHDEFKKLEIIDEMGDMFEYESLKELLD